MKLKYFLLSFVIALAGCASNEVSNANKKSINDFVGTYKSGFNTLIIYPATNKSAVLYMDVHGGPPNYTGGSFYGEITLANDQLHHSSVWRDYENKTCEFTISTINNIATVEFVNNQESCGSGFYRYQFTGDYPRISNTPKVKVVSNFTDHICSLDDLSKELIKNKMIRVISNEDCASLKY
jgi:hypothetical protein